MKTTAAYYLLLLYTLAICKPVIPLVQDAVAHFFWEADHIATVHNHHGDHHAEEEIAASALEEESDKAPATSKTSEPLSLHLIVQNIYTLPQLPLREQKFGRHIYTVPTLFLDKHYPPPKSS